MNKNKIIYEESTYKRVDNINAYLLDAPNILLKSISKPLCSIPKMTTGNRPADGGHLIIEKDQINDFIKNEPKSKRWIKKLTGAREYLHNEDRYCLWLVGITPKELHQMPLVLQRVEECKKDRLNGAKDRQKLAETPWLFREQKNPANY